MAYSSQEEGWRSGSVIIPRGGGLVGGGEEVSPMVCVGENPREITLVFSG